MTSNQSHTCVSLPVFLKSGLAHDNRIDCAITRMCTVLICACVIAVKQDSRTGDSNGMGV